MRKLIIIPCVIATFVAGACRDRHSNAGDANAAEVTTVSPETFQRFDPDRCGRRGSRLLRKRQRRQFNEKRYDEAVRLFNTYTTEKPDNVWGFYMLGLSAWKTG